MVLYNLMSSSAIKTADKQAHISCSLSSSNGVLNQITNSSHITDLDTIII